eukprot:6212230-Pleurochrysis_carterae.AAC.1
MRKGSLCAVVPSVNIELRRGRGGSCRLAEHVVFCLAYRCRKWHYGMVSIETGEEGRQWSAARQAEIVSDIASHLMRWHAVLGYERSGEVIDAGLLEWAKRRTVQPATAGESSSAS